MKGLLCVLLIIGVASAYELSLAKYRQRGEDSPRIIGGEEAEPNSWPWQASVLLFGSHTCGGVVLNANWILTAGHCIILPDTVYLGAHNLLAEDGVEYTVAYAVEHPDIDLDPSIGFPNDLALLRLVTPVTPTDKIQFANLPSSGDADYSNSRCVITGWGVPEEGGILPSDVLRQADVNAITTEECQALWDGIGITVPISNIHQCVYDRADNQRGSCSGDSGGPLNCQNSAGEWEVAGITSWGINTCTPTAPSVYVRVATYLTWIRDTIAADP